jgi:hypothetical protein
VLIGANSLVLVPALLVAGTGACSLLPPERRGTGRVIAGLAIGFALAVLLQAVPTVAGGGTVTADFGDAVPGVGLVLRADAPGLLLAGAALGAALLSLAESRRRPFEEAALLLCAAGAVLAALAGNAILLYGGAEIGSVGTLLLVAVSRGRIGRGTLLAFVLEHAALLALLLSAAFLDSLVGTTDFTALPPGSLSLPLALPWAAAGAGRLLALALPPGARDVRASRAWAATAAVPVGGAILVRLLEASGGSLPLAVGISLAALGTLVALAGAASAWRWVADARLAGRALLVAATGPVIALAGIPGGAAGFAALLVALELAVLAAPAWGVGLRAGRAGRGAAALALCVAGGLPIGWGTSAAILGLGAVAALGRPWMAVLDGLSLAALIAAMASLRVARRVLLAEHPADRRLRLDCVIALGASAAAALLPGVVGGHLVTALSGVTPDSPGAGSLRVAGAAWPAGSLALAAGLLAAIGFSAAHLLGWRSAPPLPLRELEPPAPWTALLRPRRRLGPAVHGLPRLVAGADRWLVVQPQFGFGLAAAVVALFVFR